MDNGEPARDSPGVLQELGQKYLQKHAWLYCLCSKRRKPDIHPSINLCRHAGASAEENPMTPFGSETKGDDRAVFQLCYFVDAS